MSEPDRVSLAFIWDKDDPGFSRRTFVKTMGFASAAGFIAACGGSSGKSLSPASKKAEPKEPRMFIGGAANPFGEFRVRRENFHVVAANLESATDEGRSALKITNAQSEVDAAVVRVVAAITAAGGPSGVSQADLDAVDKIASTAKTIAPDAPVPPVLA